MNLRERLERLESAAPPDPSERERQSAAWFARVGADPEASRLAAELEAYTSTLAAPGGGWAIESINADPRASRLANDLVRRLAMIEDAERAAAPAAGGRPNG